MPTFQHLLDKAASFRANVKVNPYLLAFLFVLLLVILRWLLHSILLDNAPLIFFIIPVIIAAWYGGFGPGLFATVLGMFAGTYFIVIESIPNGQMYASIIIRLMIFFIEGFLISFLIESRNKSEREREEILMREKLARRSAEQQKRVREHFISVASHELKSPLTSQKAFIQLLRRSIAQGDTSKVEGFLNKIEDQADKLTQFTNDLLDVSKMNSKKLQYHFDYFPLTECVQEAIDAISNLLVNHKVIFKGRIKAQVFGDRSRIYQVITNLLSNAIKYSPNGKKIVITLMKDKKYVTVSVRDFGMGVDPAYQKKIFNRFFRVNDDESTFQGFGLGLYITAQIVRKHKGKIWVESIVGKGSTFYFTVPVKN